MQLGEKIKYFRKKKGLTIKQLSELTNLSNGFISNIERDLNSPSVSNLQQICKVLDINIVDLIQTSDDTQSLIVRKKDRQNFFKTSDNNVKFELLSPKDKMLTGICIVLEPHSNYGNTSWGHNYEEIGVVIEGCLEIKIDNDVYLLNKGDSVYINKFTPHNYRNNGDETCISHWFSVKEGEI
ncbi:helix-turn-helix domain-containing protein [Wukongibacter sp. M2B1]|uniref:helix-turn-helix domain-containing protein n=1 Tax=Wukongibacter sp. M2B1 TaxID=3088895 RepID=UPI003D7B2067